MLKNHKNAKDIIGQRFGWLTVVGIDEEKTSERDRIYWKCQCDCGKTSSSPTHQLNSGKTRSCGCRQGHGMSRTRQYRTWVNIIKRCNNEHDTNYRYYGDRGITVCDKWLTFRGFWEDMQEGYDDTLSIERVDVEGNYEKENCRWATPYEQSINRRNTPFYVIDGERMCMPEISKKYSISLGTLGQRLRKGMDPKLAATTPVETKFYRKAFR